MISKERKKELGRLYAEDQDGLWKSELAREEYQLILSWDYAFYTEKMRLTEEIMKRVNAEIHENGCLIETDRHTKENSKEYRKIEFALDKKEYRKLKAKAACAGCSIEELLESFFQALLEGNDTIDEWLARLSTQNEEDFLMYLIRKELLGEIEDMIGTIEDCSAAIEECTKELLIGAIQNQFGGIRTYRSWKSMVKNRKEWEEGLKKEIEDSLSVIEETQKKILGFWKKYLKETNKEKYDGAFHLEMSSVIKWLEDLWESDK